jgi:general secretion pathway protein J
MKGYTLLEMLVAVSIFAVISAMSFGGLWRATLLHERLERERAFWTRLSAAFTLLRADALQTRERSSRGLPTVAGEPGKLQLLCAERSGGIRRLTYRLHEMKLYRGVQSWPRGPAFESVLLEDVREFRPRFMTNSGRWSERWAAGRPRAIEVSLSVGDKGGFTRLFAYPER